MLKSFLSTITKDGLLSPLSIGGSGGGAPPVDPLESFFLITQEGNPLVTQDGSNLIHT